MACRAEEEETGGGWSDRRGREEAWPLGVGEERRWPGLYISARARKAWAGRGDGNGRHRRASPVAAARADGLDPAAPLWACGADHHAYDLERALLLTWRGKTKTAGDVAAANRGQRRDETKGKGEPPKEGIEIERTTAKFSLISLRV